MTRLADIEGHIGSMSELLDIVGAMRSLASMRVREAHRAVAGVRRYAQSMASAIGDALRLMPDGRGERPRTRGPRALRLRRPRKIASARSTPVPERGACDRRAPGGMIPALATFSKDEREMRPFIAVILIAALASPAYSAERPSVANAARAAAENAERSKAEDKAFTDAVKRIRLPEKKYDPWGVVRDPKGAGGYSSPR